jgi:23S rRNA (cytosine1962-C5)-methyltransferase
MLARAVDRRRAMIDANVEALRIFSGQADGVDGIFVDRYGFGAVLIYYEGRAPRDFHPHTQATTILETLQPLGVTAVYLKPFARDRSHLGGDLPEVATQATPAAGQPLPEAIVVREADRQLEVRLYDGLSTGLFLDQRENRTWVANWATARGGAGKSAPLVLNTFAYTCAFSVAAAMSGAITTSVDVSARYLDWGKRNFEHNRLDASLHRFAKMDTFEFFGYARRKQLRYDLIILDPPSFAAGSKRKKIRPWSAVDDYARLVHEAAELLNAKGAIFASTNTQELCRPGRLEREIVRGLGRQPKWIDLPPVPQDFSRDLDRFAARALA